MSLIFADAGYWIALRNRRDVAHERAIEIARKLLRERLMIVTTPFVFAEVYAIFSRAGAAREQVIRDVWGNPIVQVEQPSYEDQQHSLRVLKEHGDKSFSFADAVSFVVMERLGVNTAVSFDDHFKQYGKFSIIDAA